MTTKSPGSWRAYSTPEKLRTAARLRAETWARAAHTGQAPPPGDWHTWLARGGRGAGKTRAGAQALASWLPLADAGRWAIVAPTFAEARDKCVEGESGMLTAMGTTVAEVKAGTSTSVATWNRSIGELVLLDGTAIIIDGADDGATSIQGENLCGVWADEVGLWKKWQLAWEESIGFAVRKDPALIVATGTPKGNQGIIRLLRNEAKGVVETLIPLRENIENLSAKRVETLFGKYEGTRLGLQELEGMILEDVEGALWKLAQIDADRAVVDHPNETDLIGLPAMNRRLVVAVDPGGESEDADETGIIVAGCKGEHGYVVDDRSGHYSPSGWAEAAIKAYEDWDADRIVVERNHGGDMAEATLRTVNPNVPVRTVWASKGKAVRAEPVSALYEQHRIHHCGTFPDLEVEQTTWVPNETGQVSPNRMDALVWAFTDLMLGGGHATVATTDPGSESSITADLLEKRW